MTDDWPVALAFAFFFVGALARGNATYWAGRALRAGGQRSRFAGHLDRPAVQRAERVVTRFGAAAVTMSFLTIGFQTAVNAAAGGLRMPQRRYLPAVVLGALIWATIYTTIGFAVLQAWFGRAGWPWVVAAALAVVVVAVATAALRRRRQESGPTPPDRSDPEPPAE